MRPRKEWLVGSNVKQWLVASDVKAANPECLDLTGWEWLGDNSEKTGWMGLTKEDWLKGLAEGTS